MGLGDHRQRQRAITGSGIAPSPAAVTAPSPAAVTARSRAVGTRAITGSGNRAITGSGNRAITGSGNRAITGSGNRAITGSGNRAITGSGNRAITGSGNRAITGSGNRAITGSGNRAITGSGNRAITGSGNRAITGSGNRAITGSGNRAITGSGNRAITGSGNRAITGSGNRSIASGGGGAPEGVASGGSQLVTFAFESAAMGPVESISQSADSASIVILGQTYVTDVASTSGIAEGDYVFAAGSSDGVLRVFYSVGTPYIPGASAVMLVGAVDDIRPAVSAMAVKNVVVDYSSRLVGHPDYSPTPGTIIQATGVQPLPRGTILLQE